MTGVGSSPALATCETSHVLLAGVSGGFPGLLPFRPTYQLACFDMSEIILKGTLQRLRKQSFSRDHAIISLKLLNFEVNVRTSVNLTFRTEF